MVAVDNAPRFVCFFSDAINATCSSRCWEYSCWGPSEDQCVRCPRYRHNVTRVCLTSCDEEPRLYADDSAPQKQCQPCDPLCLNNCTGPVTATLCLQKSSPTLFLWLPGAVQRGGRGGPRSPVKILPPPVAPQWSLWWSIIYHLLGVVHMAI